MTLKGKIECRITAGSYAVNEQFVSIWNFLNNLSLIGVTRIAYYAGSGGSTLMDYWDAGASVYANSPGTNAYGVWRFGNATIPFYVLVQSVGNRGSTIAVENVVARPGLIGGMTSYNPYIGNAIQFAMRLDGTSPWQGGTANAGADNKTPGSGAVWAAGSSQLAAFPRVNSSGGSATKAEAMCHISTINIGSDYNNYYNDIYNDGCRMHLLADENNFMILMDNGANGSYACIYFGKYVPRPGITTQIPYVMLHMANQVNSPPFKRINYGAAASISSQYDWLSNAEGGIVNPVASNGVKACYVDYSPTFTDARFHPSRAAGVAGRFDTVPFHVGMNEASSYGLLGTIDFLRMCVNVPTLYTSDDRKVAVFGSYTSSDSKLVVPWDGVTSPGSGITREGVSF